MNRRIVQCDDCGKIMFSDDVDIISIIHYKGRKRMTDIRKDLCLECYKTYKKIGGINEKKSSK